MNTICQCNKLLGKPTRHPLASVLHLSLRDDMPELQPGCYAVLLIAPGTDGLLGREDCDFRDATLLAQVPGKSLELSQWLTRTDSARLLLFHQDLLVGTSLGENIKNYRFLKYSRNESLHLSAAERDKLNMVLDDIENELKRPADDFTARILSGKICGMLDYIARFHHRQLITRHDASFYDAKETNKIIDQWLLSNRIRLFGLPCVCMLAKEAGCSTSFFEDLVEFEDGMEPEKYIQLRRVKIARRLILTEEISDAQIALRLGFRSAESFRTFFRKVTGQAPNQLRTRHKDTAKRQPCFRKVKYITETES